MHRTHQRSTTMTLIKTLRLHCTRAGLRLSASGGAITVHLFGRSVPVTLHQDESGNARWELGACPVTGAEPVSAPHGEERTVAAHLSHRLRARVRERTP